MGHHHAHGHHQGHHHHSSTNRKALGLAAILTGGFMVAEIVGGVVSGSLALIADAGHMLTDFAALSMAWIAITIAQRPADSRRTYGFDRLSVLAAFVNGIALFPIAGWITFEAIMRINNPQPIEGLVMLTVAVLGLLVNIAAFWILTRGDKENLNMKAAILHVLGDLLGSVAAIIAALVILGTGWTTIDPVLSVLVAVLILRSAYAVVKESAHILLEGTPATYNSSAISADLINNVPGLNRIEHMHGWSISDERPMITLEAVLTEGADAETLRQQIKSRLSEKFGFNHTTVEIRTNSSDELPEGCTTPI